MTSSSRFTIGGSITPSSTVLSIKELISNEEASGRCPVERQRLIYKGRIMSENSKTLRDYGIVANDQTVHLVKGAAPAPAAPSPSANTSSSTTSTPSTNATNNPFAAFQQSMQQNPMGAGATPGSGDGFGFPNMMDPSQMQQEMLQNPEMMSSIMNSPIMQNLMSNPDIMRTMMQSNPQMQELMESNPELRNIMDDPEMMRRSMEMLRDPNAMRNAMRNQDLAMSQIENIPGGFSALRRMYEDVQEPMMDAMSGSAGNASGSSTSNANSGSSSNNAGSGAAGMAMPNPWGSSSSNTPRSNTGGVGSASNTSSTNPMNNPLPTGSGVGSMIGMPPNPWAAGTSGSGAAPTPGQMPNMEQTISMLENPMISSMMDQLMSDPATMQSMMDSNPMLRQMRESNPQLAAMISNPEMMRSMMRPENLRAMSQMQNAMQQLGMNLPGGLPGMPPPGVGNPPPSIPAGGPGGMDFSSLLNQFQSASVSGGVGGSGSTGHTAQQNQLPPEQRFRMQLQSLNDMGFDNNEANIRALTSTHGNVNRAVEYLFSNPSESNEGQTNAPSSSDTNATTEANAGNENEGSAEGSREKKND